MASQLGLRVPDDLSLIAFSEQSLLPIRLRATVLQHEWQRVGQFASEMLVRKMRNRKARIEPMVHRFQFVPGETCMPPTGQTSLI